MAEAAERRPIPATDAGPMSRQEIEGKLGAMFGVQPEPEQAQPEPAPQDGGEPQPEQTEGDPAPAPIEEPGDEGQITIDPEAPIFEIPVKGGEPEKVSLKELEGGYMRQKDYTQKTQELARARDQLQEEVRKSVEPTVQAYQQHLGILQQAVIATIMPEMHNVDMERLAQEDPSRYVALSAKFQKAQQLVGQIQQQQQQLAAQANQQTAERSRRALSDPVTGIADWNDEMYTGIIKEGSRAYGFAPDEVAAVVDHRMIRVLHDALQYQKAKAAQPGISKKVALAPKLVRAGTPTSSSDRQQTTEKELMARLKKSRGSRDNIEAAAALWDARQKRR
jgi:hypothetical protein